MNQNGTEGGGEADVIVTATSAAAAGLMHRRSRREGSSPLTAGRTGPPALTRGTSFGCLTSLEVLVTP